MVVIKKTVYKAPNALFIFRRWLYNISRGIDRDPVQVKLISKSIGCCKRFPGRTSLCRSDEVEQWMKELSGEIADRLEEDLRENNRKGRLMTVSFSQETNQTEVSSTRAIPLKSYEMERICQQALEVVNKFCRKADGSYHITFLGLSISNFENIKNVNTITSYFGKVSKMQQRSQGSENQTKHKDINNETGDNKSTITTQNSRTVYPESIIDCSKTPEKRIENANVDSTADEPRDCDDNSIYSDTTEELEENPDDYIFYTGGKSESSEENVNEFDKNLNDSTVNVLQTSDSIVTSEIGMDSNPLVESPVLGSRYKYDENDSPEEIERNFDTSKIFEGHCLSSDEELDGANISSSHMTELSEQCKECGEIIPIIDIVSHMDYHLALKLSQEVFPSAETTAVVNKKQTNNKKPPSKKRKVDDTVGSSIDSFLKKQEIDTEENSELCTQCNKRIKVVDMSMHFDYHAARELHLKLNNPSANGTSANVKNFTSMASNSRQVEKRKKNAGNIASFFKQLDPSL